MLFCVFHCVAGTALFTVVHSDNTSTMIYHPLISYLKTGTAVSWANKAYQISRVHNIVIPPLPIAAPRAFKAFVRACANKFDCGVLFPLL